MNGQSEPAVMDGVQKGLAHTLKPEFHLQSREEEGMNLVVLIGVSSSLAFTLFRGSE